MLICEVKLIFALEKKSLSTALGYQLLGWFLFLLDCIICTLHCETWLSGCVVTSLISHANGSLKHEREDMGGLESHAWTVWFLVASATTTRQPTKMLFYSHVPLLCPYCCLD